MNIKTKLGFTLIEILVVVLIIGILGAIALPQYQRAVQKSRYSGMMPIAKSLAEANEVYYLEHGEYSENPADLLVAGRDKNAGAYPDGTRVLMYDEDGLSYVRVTNDNIPNARYLVYQKHSANFPDTTQCEAADDRANELCVALDGQIIEGGNSSGETKWTAYLLSGRYGSEDQLIPANDDNGGGDSGDEGGDEPGTNTDPQTPSKPTCGGVEQPDDIEPTETNPATGTATCVNGQWKYQWTGGNVYDTDYGGYTTVCTGNSAYACAGSEFKGKWNKCEATQEDGCAGSTFSGNASQCLGNVANGCADSTFSGNQGRCFGNAAYGCAGSTINGPYNGCIGNVANGCSGTTFSGDRSLCIGQAANGCSGAEIQAGAFCSANVAGGCDGTKYGTHPNKDSSLIGSCYDANGFCPTGVPLRGDWNATTQSYNLSGWKGNCCNPAYMVSGVCPSGIAICQ